MPTSTPCAHLGNVVPNLAAEPASFTDYNFLPTVQFHAPRDSVAALATLLVRNDASGLCRVAHMSVGGTATFRIKLRTTRILIGLSMSICTVRSAAASGRFRLEKRSPNASPRRL
jgi:hypothetical protein